MGADHTHFGRLLETYENNFTQGLDRYPHTRTDTFNILANYKNNKHNYMWVVQSNDGVAFTTCDEANNHHDTHENDITPIDNPSTTSDLTTSTNPQQHGSTLVTTGGGHGCNHNARGSTGHGRSDGCTITCFCCGETGHYASACPYSLEESQQCLAAAQSARSDNDTETAEQLFMSGNMSGEQEDVDTAYQSWCPPMGTPKPTMALTSQKNGSCLIANPLSPSSVTIDSSGSSANPMGG